MQLTNICFNFSINIRNRLVFNVKRQFSRDAKQLDFQEITTMKVLHVAEKNDAAKNISAHLSRNTSRRREGISKFNKIYEWEALLFNQNCKMIMTSVSGHLLTYEFTGAYRKWYGCPPLSLFDAPVVKQCIEESSEKIKRTLEREVKTCGALIIWTDCDREGENIGFEIIKVCQAVKPSINIYRAKFSEITQISVDRALRNLEQPDQRQSDAVDVRSELDLRIGAAFTRFQTLRLRKKFPQNLADMLISYGPCQFPTLGFVVERFLAIERFQPEPYWKLKVIHEQNDLAVEFRWARNRLFEKLPCEVFLDICQENPQATVEKVSNKPKSKWRPLPLDTIELEKQGSRKLRLSAKQTMQIAEKLYTQGFISYPRTETNIFPKEMNLTTLVTQQSNCNAPWSIFAQRILEEGISPRQGKKSDQAHPPIHPTKYADSLQGDEARVYEFVVRHFLACISKNAEGFETLVEIDIAGEKFATTGLQIIAKNYLEVYIYEKWNAKEIHIYEMGQTFIPTSIEMVEETTSAPNLLTEADLIALMDKHGIGTDATHAEHIETIKSRHYVGLRDNKYLIPGKLGIGLVMGYDRMGFHMSKPNLRAELESDLKLICEGQKQPDEVRQRTINKYREVFREALVRANMIDEALAEYLNERPVEVAEEEISVPDENEPILKCPKCNSNMVIKTKRQNNGKYIGCMGYPTCNNVIWLPETVEKIEVLDERCSTCPENVLKKIRVKLTRNAFSVLGTSYEACIGGCDAMFNDCMNIRRNSVRRPNAGDDGYDSNSSSSSSRSQQRNQSTNRNQTSSNGNNAGNQSNQNFGGNRNNDASWNNNRNQSNRNNDTSWNSSGYHSNNQSRSNNTWNQSSTSTSNTIVTDGANNYNWANDNSGEIVCNCHEPAKILTVRKEGPNQGRTFYKCAKPSNQSCNFFLWGTESDAAGSSSAILRPAASNWNQNQNNRQNFTNNRQNNQSSTNISGNWDDDADGWHNENEVTCNCGQSAKKLTVHKEGPNKGRQFYSCPQGPNSPCNFFQWADGNTGGGGGRGRGGSSSWNNGQGGGDAGGGYSRGDNSNWGGPPARGRGRGRGGSAGTAPKRPKASAGGGTSKRKCGICGVEGHTKRTCPQNN
ncbi:DNA topoisomerase 3-alpha [Phymastichus coffea]|uniref:DNA topoisomerase 3-alpha n=1 Tax=Phymastichus coffea TaxID=108790 RepID=UPI00273C7788|nr:DNA topoisomerase 3-alpha [Phymastichus coffea]